VKLSAYRIIDNFITPNKYSRPQKKMGKPKGIVLHWVANKNSTAAANRNYFESRKEGKKGYGSAHEIIDLNGDIIRCIPPNEMAYGAGSETYTKRALHYLGSYPNNCTYHIECTHIDDKGTMTEATYSTLVQRCADLSKEWGLDPKPMGDLWLHQEVVGWKDCHRWFVQNPLKWHKFQEEVFEMMKGGIVMGKVFKDVADDRWSAKHIEAAKKLGIVNGNADGTFNPGGNVTREQLAVVAVNLYEAVTGRKVVEE
jgi:N-acetylmuramoyl-L-alanine amidase